MKPLRQRRSIAWIKAFLECLDQGREVSLLRTHYQIEGYLL